MRELTKDEIKKNHVNSINLYYILDYLKKNLDIDKFKLYVDKNNIKVIDKDDNVLFFSYDKQKKQVVYSDELNPSKGDKELSL